MSTLRSLSEEQVQSYRLNGFLTVEDVLTESEVANVAERLDLIAAGKAGHVPPECIQLEPVFRSGERTVDDQVLAVRKLFMLNWHDDVMWSHAANPRIVDIIADLLGTDDLKVYNDQAFMKAPEIGSAQPWHQDSASWRDMFPMDLVTAWTAIDAATPENGCLNFAAGTHRWGMMTKEQIEPHVGELGSDRFPIVQAPLRAGSISFHHSLTLHCSGANLTGQRRRGYAVHYMRATTTRQNIDVGTMIPADFKQARGRSYPGRV
jgi:phytanoyl-CoA hydroxylase